MQTKHFISLEIFEETKANLVLSFAFGDIAQKPRNVCNWCEMIFPVERIGNTFVVFGVTITGWRARPSSSKNVNTLMFIWS